MTNAEFAEIVTSNALFACLALLYFAVRPAFESVINEFVYAVLAFVQRGNHAQSLRTKTVIVLLGHCDTAGVGGVFFSSESQALC